MTYSPTSRHLDELGFFDIIGEVNRLRKQCPNVELKGEIHYSYREDQPLRYKLVRYVNQMSRIVSFFQTANDCIQICKIIGSPYDPILKSGLTADDLVMQRLRQIQGIPNCYLICNYNKFCDTWEILAHIHWMDKESKFNISRIFVFSKQESAVTFCEKLGIPFGG